MARKKNTEPVAEDEVPAVETPPAVVVKAHSYVEIRYPNAVETRQHTGYGFYKTDFVKLIPRDEAIDLARAIEEAAKEVL